MYSLHMKTSMSFHKDVPFGMSIMVTLHIYHSCRILRIQYILNTHATYSKGILAFFKYLENVC